ncbi:MAG: heme ABC transporter ATP-binding protein [Candidatus Hydrogenedentes bacterium]|nr:heme ABC transporter ATP-binding protein [Candidatus Hydrogenedentota bacterium]
MSHRLQAEGLAFSYEAGRAVFTRVDATVRSGEVTGIVGPNGSGKSTLLRVLCGLLTPQHGQVLLDGRPLASFRSTERARTLAFLPQSVDPAFALTVFEVVCLGRYPHVGSWAGLRAQDRDVARRCMCDTETEQLASRDFLTLSGGERQRVLLASILAQEPDLLLLDEPTSSLDIHHQIEIFALLRRLASSGFGVAVVTHDLNLAARYCDRLLLLSTEAESVLAEGRPGEVLTEGLLSRAYAARILVSQHPITRTLLITADDPGREPEAVP